MGAPGTHHVILQLGLPLVLIVFLTQPKGALGRYLLQGAGNVSGTRVRVGPVEGQYLDQREPGTNFGGLVFGRGKGASCRRTRGREGQDSGWNRLDVEMSTEQRGRPYCQTQTRTSWLEGTGVWNKHSGGAKLAAAPTLQDMHWLDLVWEAWPVAAAYCHTCPPGS